MLGVFFTSIDANLSNLPQFIGQGWKNLAIFAVK
jgi:hypothetical protein